HYYSARYYKLALLYSYLKAPALIATRTQIPAVMELLKQAGLPVLWEHHEQITSDSHLRQFFQYPNLVGVVTISPYLAKNFIEHGLSADRIIVAPSGVDLESFLPDRSKEAARQQLGLDPAAKLIVYSGHLYDYKGIPTILSVARLMPHCQFILVGGWAEDIARVQTTIQTQGLSNVRIVGHIPQPQIVPYLYAADVLLLPTSKSWQLSEVTSPLKLFEYMAVKRPIVSSALPTIMTVLRHQETGLLVEPDEPIAFQNAITQLLESPDFAQTIADRAYEAVQDFTWEKRATRILDFAAQQLDQHVKQRPSNSLQFIRSLQASF
ncbi:MAG TPA: glycosyltransferase family 4 protein, partial [Allocoleopsis sp.]